MEFLKQFSIQNNGFELEHEITIKIMKHAQIKEVPINYYPRSYREGKKITVWDGFKIFKTLLRYRIINEKKFTYQLSH